MDQRLHKQQKFPIYVDFDSAALIDQIIKNIMQRQVEEFERRFFVQGDGNVSGP
mgnify:CR=1 FL=1